MLSTTSTVKLHEVIVTFLLSLALYVTVVTPNGNTSFGLWELVIVTLSQLPDTSGGVHVAEAVHWPGAVNTCMLGGHDPNNVHCCAYTFTTESKKRHRIETQYL